MTPGDYPEYSTEAASKLGLFVAVTTDKPSSPGVPKDDKLNK